MRSRHVFRPQALRLETVSGLGYRARCSPTRLGWRRSRHAAARCGWPSSSGSGRIPRCVVSAPLTEMRPAADGGKPPVGFRPGSGKRMPADHQIGVCGWSALSRPTRDIPPKVRVGLQARHSALFSRTDPQDQPRARVAIRNSSRAASACSSRPVASPSSASDHFS